MPADVVLTAGDARLAVDRDGGRWASWTAGGYELLGRGAPQVTGWGCFPMAPWAGRVRGGRLEWRGRTHQLPLAEPPHALHGVVLDRDWSLDDVDASSARLSCRLDSRWPWRGSAVQVLRLEGDALHAELRVELRDHHDEPMPAWAGFHPWLRRRLADGAPAEVLVDADGVLAKVDGVATAEVVGVPLQPWDDSFEGVRWPVRVRWDDALELSVDATSSAGDPVAVVFTEKRAAVCVEPQTAPPDAAALGRAAVVTEEEPLVLSTTWRWRTP